MFDLIVLGLVVAWALFGWWMYEKASKADRDVTAAYGELRQANETVKVLLAKQSRRAGALVDADIKMRNLVSRDWTIEQCEEYRVAMIKMCAAMLTEALIETMEPAE